MTEPDLDARLKGIEARLIQLEELAKESLGIPKDMNLSDLQEPPITEEPPTWII